MENNKHPTPPLWEKQEWESKLWHSRFSKFYLLKEDRSVNEAYRQYWQKVNQKSTKSQPKQANWLWKKNAWPKDHPSWPQRAEAYDAYLRDKAKAAWEAKFMGEEEVKGRLADIGRGSMANFSNVYTQADLKDHPHAHLVKSISTTIIDKGKAGSTVKTTFHLYSAHEALRDIGKTHKIFTDKVEVEMTNWRDFLPEGVSPEKVLDKMSDVIKEADDVSVSPV